MKQMHTPLAIAGYSKTKQWKKRNLSFVNMVYVSDVVMEDIPHENVRNMCCVKNAIQIDTAMRCMRQEIPLLCIAGKATE